MNKILFIPADSKNRPLAENLIKSIRKFHSEEELPIKIIDEQIATEYDDQNFWYRAAPLVASTLIKDYDLVIKMDADQLVLGPLDELFNFVGDVGVVLNDPTYPIGVWDIKTPDYYNNGLVVMRNKEFVGHWKRLCQSSHFLNYQFREQDILNLLCSDYFNYQVNCLDGDKIYGEWAKSQWVKAKMKDGKVLLPENKELRVIHWGGGQGAPDKGKYRLRFQKDVVAYIDGLLK